MLLGHQFIYWIIKFINSRHDYPMAGLFICILYHLVNLEQQGWLEEYQVLDISQSELKGQFKHRSLQSFVSHLWGQSVPLNMEITVQICRAGNCTEMLSREFCMTLNVLNVIWILNYFLMLNLKSSFEPHFQS